MHEGIDSIMTGLFLEKLKEFLNIQGVQWNSIEHRIIGMDNKVSVTDKEEGYIEIRYLVRIPYHPEIKNGKEENKEVKAQG